MFSLSALYRVFTYALFIQLILLLSLVSIGCNTKPETQGENQSRLTTSANHAISLNDAIKLTGTFRSGVSSGAVLAESFDASAIRGLIDQQGCTGVRIYYGKKEDGSPALVLVGTDSVGTDMIGGSLVETGFPCPPICDSKSPLAN